MLDRLEVFKAGSHRAVDGKVYVFSEADVAAIAAAYDPALQCGPIVLGHPKTDDPAWGWVKGLTAEGGTLFAELEKVDPAFSEGVEAGRYRYVSSAFYAPDDAASPKPGAWYLRHVGFLGAQPPAVKGLTPAFSEPPAESLIAFSTAADADVVKDIFRGLRDWMIEKEGIETADKFLPRWWLDSIDLSPSQLAPAFSEATEPAPAGDDTITGAAGDDTISAATEAAFAERQAELDARDTEIRRREVAFAEGQRERARSEDAAFLDSLVEAGRLPPAHRERVATLLGRLDGDTTVAFAEPDANPRAEMRQLLEGLGVSIQFAEFSASDGFTGAHDPNVLAAKARELVDAAAAKGQSLSYAAAVQQAQAR